MLYRAFSRSLLAGRCAMRRKYAPMIERGGTMPSINESYQAHAGNYTPGGNSCAYIVVHNTGNSADANAEARYAASSQHNSSYHYVLDDDEIYHVLDDYDTAWAVGAWSGARQLIGNNESISIEVCSGGTPFSGAEIENLTWLVGVLMERHNIPAENVVRHYDCHTGHKNCPAAYTDDNAWYGLWQQITNGEDIMTEQDKQDIIAGVLGGVGSNVWGFTYEGIEETPYTMVVRIRENTTPNKPWEYIYAAGTKDEDKTLGDGMDSNRYNVLNAIYNKVCALEKRIDEIEK